MYSITIYDKHNADEMEKRSLAIIAILRKRYNAENDQLFKELEIVTHDLANMEWESVDTLF